MYSPFRKAKGEMGGGNSKSRWKIFIYRSSSSSASSSSKFDKKDPPKELLCPIYGSLMYDPVVVSSGQTFERTSVQVCKDLGFKPQLPNGSTPDFSNVIPNLALRTTILSWCEKSGAEKPRPPDYYAVESTVRTLVPSSSVSTTKEDPRIRVSERELLKSVAENPPMLLSHAASELTPRNNHHFYSPSSSEESVIANNSPLLPFTTRPSCYSSSSSQSTSSEIIVSDEVPSSASTSSEDDYYVVQFKKLDVYDQEQAVISLRKSTRTDEEARVSLCTPRLLSALKPLMVSRYASVQTNAVAAMVNLSLAEVNKVRIVRAGITPLLIDVLKGGFEESQEHAAGAIFSLALEDDNKTAIGVLGALQPLLHALRSGTERTRHDSALALYHLTLVQSNRAKLIKLGAASTLLGMLKSGDMAGRVVLVVCNLAVCQEGKTALLDANAVEVLVGILRKGSELDESTRENCVAALYSLSHGSLRFKGLAKEAKAAEILQTVVERGSERAREKAKRMLISMRGRYKEEDDEEEVDWEGVLEGRVSRIQYRVGRTTHNLNSTEF
ncbi:U-box domain-containing protein 40-like [Nicotiana tabacum]|uniref:RING-type E3 ubiquitin transferase n=1 Tax=Nicotiana tabacum TaxID=4097 RepID=A0A1S3ZVT6_TOBAC|nr:PREDICTED: U-box domain-containing protein 38-like [Nicotiana tabacum]